MSKELTPDDLQQQAENYRKVVKASMDRRDTLKAKIKDFKQQKVSGAKIKGLEDEIRLLDSQTQDLLSKAYDLDALGIMSIMTNLENAKEQIKATTDKVLKAIQKFNDMKELLRVLSLFVRLGAAIVNTVATGGAPADQIATLVSEVDNLTFNL
ncbi:hypothetical protein Cal6303_2039 [Calothrix sp. PCC 6303]|nr:hypothetical protein Cal6303_2039 [Calothrix sp. PCC 6303]